VTPDVAVASTDIISDNVRGHFLKLSRALAMFLLVMYVLHLVINLMAFLKDLLDRYVCSRFYLHDPPGIRESLYDHEDAPESFKAAVQETERGDPELNPWVCIILLAVTAVLIGLTTELVSSSVSSLKLCFSSHENGFR
jgi:Ca2+:H+ antiporter